MSGSTNRDLLTPVEAAKYLGIHRHTLRKYTRQGEIPFCVLFPGKVRYERRVLESLIMLQITKTNSNQQEEKLWHSDQPNEK